jgi:hypothetical protein
VNPTSIHQARTARDAVAKTIYSRLFDWLGNIHFSSFCILCYFFVSFRFFFLSIYVYFMFIFSLSLFTTTKKMNTTASKKTTFADDSFFFSLLLFKLAHTVNCVNDALANDSSDTEGLSINVLDIYGFEVKDDLLITKWSREGKKSE